MIKEWFVLVQDRKLGPFSIEELRRKKFITPDTLVWKKGFTKWKKAGLVKELASVFKDEPQPLSKKKDTYQTPPKYNEILELGMPSGNWLWWWALFILALLYAIYRLYYA